MSLREREKRHWKKTTKTKTSAEEGRHWPVNDGKGAWLAVEHCHSRGLHDCTISAADGIGIQMLCRKCRPVGVIPASEREWIDGGAVGSNTCDVITIAHISIHGVACYYWLERELMGYR